MFVRIGFLVNPIAGIGGRVGLKGSDNVEDEARRRGAELVSPDRAREAIKSVVARLGVRIEKVRFLTCASMMGETELLESKVPKGLIEIVHEPPLRTSSKDTKAATLIFLERRVDLILFCGGDGTARDIVAVTRDEIPIIGIPSGVKMHSGVFCMRPEALASIIEGFLDERIGTGEADILDLDEERYREGNWIVRMYATAVTLREPNLIQAGKLRVEEVPDKAIKDEMAEHIAELMEKEPEALFIFGPGSTITHLAKKLNIEKTLLGIDAVVKSALVGKDLNEKGLLSLLKQHRSARIVLSPIGAQGFILGRGNLQLSPKVVSRVGIQNILIFATPSKLQVTPTLRVDSGDPALDAEFAKKHYLPVVTGYRTMRMHPLQV